MLDLAGDLEGEFEGGGGFASADLGLRAGAGAGDEIGQFALERLHLFDLDRFAHDAFAGEFGDDGGVGGHAEQFAQQRAFLFVVAGQAQQVAALVLVIEREIGVLLEDADLAQFVLADAAGGDVGHAAVLEADAHIGDVLAIAQDRHADGIHLHPRRADEVQDDLEVVDHDIEHDADIQAAAGIGREPRGLDEARMGEARLERGEHGIETLDVADLEDDAVFLREVAKFARLLRRFDEGFFHEHVLAVFEQVFGDGEVGDGGRGDGGGIDGVGELLEIGGAARGIWRRLIGGGLGM